MPSVLEARCANHPLREAAARCPGCGGAYCRECVTEHADRVLCAACLRREAGADATLGPSRFRRLLRLMPAGLGFLIAWIFFYWVGRGLLLLPADYPEDAGQAQVPSSAQLSPRTGH